jgi:hypothetical protein
MTKENNEVEIEYNKYMVVTDIGTDNEDIYGVYETEIDALRRFRKIKHRNKKVIKADIKYMYLHDVQFIESYEIIK